MVLDRPLQKTLLALAGIGVAGPVSAQIIEDVPRELADVGVVEHLDDVVPLDLAFNDERGRPVRLGDFFDGERPVVLTLNYYRCPMLCGLQLNGFTEGLRGVDWSVGDEFEIVTVSINPLETPVLASQKKQGYLQSYGRPGSDAGWHFLTGREPAIRELARSVGFGYRYDASSGEYAHPAVAIVCTPDGRIARYLYGVEYPPRHLRLAIVEASEGTIGNAFDQLILYCFHYDPSTRRYAPVAMNIMRVGGGLTVSLLALVLGGLWLRDGRGSARPVEGQDA